MFSLRFFHISLHDFHAVYTRHSSYSLLNLWVLFLTTSHHLPISVPTCLSPNPIHFPSIAFLSPSELSQQHHPHSTITSWRMGSSHRIAGHCAVRKDSPLWHGKDRSRRTSAWRNRSAPNPPHLFQRLYLPSPSRMATSSIQTCLVDDGKKDPSNWIGGVVCGDRSSYWDNVRSV